MQSLLKLALEEAAHGKKFDEKEYVLYARLAEPVDVPPGYNAVVEHQEQWELKIPKSEQNGGQGGIRIRKTVELRGKKAGKPDYVMTTKVRHPDGANDECPIAATEANFDLFRVLSDRGMIKDRYSYPIADKDVPTGMGKGLVWECDFFLKPDGSYHPWVKIDLEVKQFVSPLRSSEIEFPPFPFEALQWIVTQTGARNEEEETLVRSLYDTMFLTRNLYSAVAPTGVVASGARPAGVTDPYPLATAQTQAMGARSVYMPEGLGYLTHAEAHAKAQLGAPASVPMEVAGQHYQVPNPAGKGTTAASTGSQFTHAGIVSTTITK
ncbi:hypothetical protein [Paraburkholderia sp. BCC1886]|uniref:hypothetical protein n=1 Tax=Paraburkholderia sp. BCC1886 TaxID=2562670 RepID=UPI001182AB35|nr:hypothetical protein [Paraburkholderia sp. BCC1886]